MKTLITINIGLSDKNCNPVQLHTALSAITAAGIVTLASGVVTGQWEGVEEQTLVISGLCHEIPYAALELVAKLLSQHCIAIHSNGRGELIPPVAEFDAKFFHFHANN